MNKLYRPTPAERCRVLVVAKLQSCVSLSVIDRLVADGFSLDVIVSSFDAQFRPCFVSLERMRRLCRAEAYQRGIANDQKRRNSEADKIKANENAIRARVIELAGNTDSDQVSHCFDIVSCLDPLARAKWVRSLERGEQWATEIIPLVQHLDPEKLKEKGSRATLNATMSFWKLYRASHPEEPE
jgi:hypothetical protein